MQRSRAIMQNVGLLGPPRAAHRLRQNHQIAKLPARNDEIGVVAVLQRQICVLRFLPSFRQRLLHVGRQFRDELLIFRDRNPVGQARREELAQFRVVLGAVVGPDELFDVLYRGVFVDRGNIVTLLAQRLDDFDETGGNIEIGRLEIFLPGRGVP